MNAAWPWSEGRAREEDTLVGKNIALVVAGSGEIRDLNISPGTKVREVMTTTGLQGYLASTGPDRPFLRPDDDLYEAVAEGAKIFASTPAEAGGR